MINVDKETQRISQGDIFKDIYYIEYVKEKNGVLEISKIIFPYVIVLTQDCDLAQDDNCREKQEKYQKQANRENLEDEENQDKIILSVLVAPLYNVDHVYQGEHLSLLNLKMGRIPKTRTPGDYLRKNERPRYHFIEFPERIVPSVIDFKHYFCVNVEYLREIREQNYIFTVSKLFREQISQRFANYLSRIGLP
jgi:hypothetical protein